MKKIFVLMSLVVMWFVANAQLFVAGGVAASYYGGSTENYNSPVNTITHDPVEFGFSVTPAVGYMILGKSYGFGLGLSYSHAFVKDVDTSPNDLQTKIFSNGFAASPFFRYAYAKFDKITLYVDAKLPVEFSKEKIRYDDLSRNLQKTFVIGARLVPGLTYKFNSHILFTTEIGILSINYLHTRQTTETSVKKGNDFIIGANNRTVASFCFVYLF